jgi:PucR family transcriptional regulator, purine catabolism regulatory protein
MRPLSVGDLLRTSNLDLRLVAGSGGLSNRIRWAHVSELQDPTPWTRGGELLLTTGMGLGSTPARQRAYLKRLIDANLAGLGIGTGFTFQRAPRAVVTAAQTAGFPVFEVPYEVPFIAITEAVFTRVAAEQYDVLSRSLDAEHVLTRAVLEGTGIEGIVQALTNALRGWAVLIDLHGAMISAVPATARTFVPLLWAELRSPRAEGQRFSLSVVERGQHISIQPVTAQGRTEAFLAVGKREALTQFDRIVASHAVSLLALELAKTRAVSEAERRLKGDLLDQILRGALAPDEAGLSLERLGFDVSKPVQCVVLCGDEPAGTLALAAEEVLARLSVPFLCSARDDLVLVVAQPDGPLFASTLRAGVAARSNEEVLSGAGSAVAFERLIHGVREARYALQVSRTEGRLDSDFQDLGTYQLLLSLQDPGALRTFADSVLAPLDGYDSQHAGDLVPSLRAFLDRNARWESAAKDLFVHRHTLRYRMRKVEELTARDLSSARDRMEFFLALRARDMLESEEWGRAGSGAAVNGRRRRLSPSYKRPSAVERSGSSREASER